MPMFVEIYIASIDKSHTCRHYYFIGIRHLMRISSLYATGLLHLDGSNLADEKMSGSKRGALVDNKLRRDPLEIRLHFCPSGGQK